MRQLIVILFAIGIGFTAIAQTNSPPTAPAPADAPGSTAAPAEAGPAKPSEPLSTTSPDNTRYQNNPDLLNACAARVAEIGDKPCDLIFIGGSQIVGWLGPGKDIWDRLYAPRHALNFGVEGDRTQNVLWRLSNMSIQNLKPKVAVVLIGTNNLMNTTHEIADGIKAVLANTQETFSGVKIILVSILPNERAEDKMMQVDSLIRGSADDESVFFLNLVPLLPSTTSTDANGKITTTWKGIGPDQLHLDASGYQIWADAMAPLLAKLLAGGT
jgi:lysophospholipase L1-like esterase